MPHPGRFQQLQPPCRQPVPAGRLVARRSSGCQRGSQPKPVYLEPSGTSPDRDRTNVTIAHEDRDDVEVAGIEPASFNVSVSLLRAQSLRDCRETEGSDTLHVSVAVCACPRRPVGTGGGRALQMKAPTPAGRELSGRTHNLRSGCEHQIVLIDVGVCIFFRLFSVDPETTARFSHFNRQSRNRSPPRWLRNPRCAGFLGRLQP